MNTGTPSVSICIPTYNSERFLTATLESLAVQTCKPDEVLVSDNASTDATCAIVRHYRDKGILSIRLIEQAHNVGAIKNWNSLVSEARGDLVAIYHADDLYDPEIIARCVDALRNDPTLGLVGTLGHMIDATGKRLFSYDLPAPADQTDQPYGFDTVFESILHNDQGHILFITPSLMVRRSVYQEVGLFEAAGRYRSAADYEMWLRIAARYPVRIFTERLISYRIHENQGSEQEVRRNRETPDIVQVWLDYLDTVTHASVRRNACRLINRMLLVFAAKQNAAGLFAKSRATLSLLLPEGGKWLQRSLMDIANLVQVRVKKASGGTVR